MMVQLLARNCVFMKTVLQFVNTNWLDTLFAKTS